MLCLGIVGGDDANVIRDSVDYYRRIPTADVSLLYAARHSIREVKEREDYEEHNNATSHVFFLGERLELHRITDCTTGDNRNQSSIKELGGASSTARVAVTIGTINPWRILVWPYPPCH